MLQKDSSTNKTSILKQLPPIIKKNLTKFIPRVDSTENGTHIIIYLISAVVGVAVLALSIFFSIRKKRNRGFNQNLYYSSPVPQI